MEKRTKPPTAFEILDGERRRKRLSVEAICNRAGMTPSTYYRRVRKPEDLTVGELDALCAVLGQNSAEVMQGAARNG